MSETLAQALERQGLTPTGVLELDTLINDCCTSEGVTPRHGNPIYRGAGEAVEDLLNYPMVAGFYEVNDWKDSGRYVWVSDEYRSILTICEGELELIACKDDFAYKREIMHQYWFYVGREGGNMTRFHSSLPIAQQAIEVFYGRL